MIYYVKGEFYVITDRVARVESAGIVRNLFGTCFYVAPSRVVVTDNFYRRVAIEVVDDGGIDSVIKFEFDFDSNRLSVKECEYESLFNSGLSEKTICSLDLKDLDLKKGSNVFCPGVDFRVIVILD